MIDKFRRKFMISFQHSGRRWFCNVLGHYDLYLQGQDPDGKWSKYRNPLKIYGTSQRWKILPSHCNNGVGKKIILPSFYRFRPAMIMIRHPAKVFNSLYRGRQARVDGFKMSLEEFVASPVLDFYIEYSNQVCSCIGQHNKLFVPYSKLYAEQFAQEKEEWCKVISFFFGAVDKDILDKSIVNNLASNKVVDGVKRYNRAKPEELGELTEQENRIFDLIKDELKLRLSPSVYAFYKDNRYA